MPRNLLESYPSPEENNQSAQPEMQQGAQLPQGESWPKFLGRQGENVDLGAADALKNILSLGLAKSKPSAEGPAYETGKIGGEIAGFLGGGEGLDALRLALMGRKLGQLPLIKQGLSALEASPLAKRLTGASIFGAAENPEDRLGGAARSALTQGVFEIPGVIGQGASKIAELFHPLEATKKEFGNIKESYANSLAKQKEAFQPFNEIQHLEMGKPKNFHEVYDENSQYFTPKIKKLERSFYSDPTLEQAHNLQSQMFSDIKSLSKGKPDAATLKTIQGLEESRNALKTDIVNRLEKINPKIANEYKRGQKIHSEEISPYFSNSKLANMVEGEVEDITPQHLIEAIKPIKEKGKGILPKEHYLREALKNIEGKVEKGNAAQYLIPLVAGGLSGQLLHPGIGGTVGGLAAGGLGSLGSQKLAEFVQNPEVAKIFEKLIPLGKKLKKGLGAGAQSLTVPGPREEGF